MRTKIFTCGDIVNKSANRNFVDKNLTKIINECDISICNFEAPIENVDMQPIKKAGPHVYQSKESVAFLKEIGFNILSLANNHIYDYGDNSLSATINEIKTNNLEYIGAGLNFNEAYSTKIIKKNGVKFGLMSACEAEFGSLLEDENRGGYAWINNDLIEDNIRELKKTADFIIFIAHSGVEEISLPLPEWRIRYKRLCDIGVDVIIGHHPHVPQGYEKHNNSMIFYSLGNFYFDSAGFAKKTDDSYSVVLEFDKDELKGFDIIYHKKINSQTTLVKKEDVKFSLEFLNNLLHKDYFENINKELVDLLKNRYLPYYGAALDLCSVRGGIIQYLKCLLKMLFFKNRNLQNRRLLLLHNIRIESHRYAVQRALSFLYEKEKNDRTS